MGCVCHTVDRVDHTVQLFITTLPLCSALPQYQTAGGMLYVSAISQSDFKCIYVQFSVLWSAKFYTQKPAA